MGVILQGAYRRSANPTVSVPAPIDGRGDPFWYDRLAMQVHDFAAAGFTHLMLPPVSMTIGGESPPSDGYGVWWEYDLGTEANPTRFGTEQRLRRLCAMCHANGITPLVDWVPHQRFGGKKGIYRYPSSGGHDKGRFPKDPGSFRGAASAGRVPDDPVADPAWDIAFGDELCPINGIPHGYVLNELKRAGEWTFRTLDLGGVRDDDTKGQAFRAVTEWASHGPMKNAAIIGEYAEGNKDTLAWWLNNVPGNCLTYDFEIKYRLRDMCNNGSHWDMRQLMNAGLSALGPQYATRAVTFVENPDSDTDGFGAVVFNKLLAYAYILTAEGWPSVYYRDYSSDRYCYGLGPHINNLVWIHENLAAGPTNFRHASEQFVVYERIGAPGLLVGLHNDVWGGPKTVTVATSFGPGASLHDYSGHAGDIRTDAAGNAVITIPPNHNGSGYCCYSRAGLDRSNEIRSRKTTQLFEGASDLITSPAMPHGTAAGSMWCEANTAISLTRESGNGVQFRVTDPHGKIIVAPGTWTGATKVPGAHKITAISAGGDEPYRLLATFQAPQRLENL
jgi:alpha-amylase